MPLSAFWWHWQQRRGVARKGEKCTAWQTTRAHTCARFVCYAVTCCRQLCLSCFAIIKFLLEDKASGQTCCWEVTDAHNTHIPCLLRTSPIKATTSSPFNEAKRFMDPLLSPCEHLPSIRLWESVFNSTQVYVGLITSKNGIYGSFFLIFSAPCDPR